MARAKNGTDEQETDEQRQELSNSAARAETIRRACREITDLDTKRKAIGAEIAEVKQKLIKGDLGMKLADFNTALRVYQLEGDDRDALFDTLRETFNALGVGEQGSFLDGLGSAGADAGYDA